jgi:RHS repeat-associated protein
LLPTKPVVLKQYHQQPEKEVATMRRVEHARSLFFDDNPAGPEAATRFLREPLPLGTLGPLALPYEQYKLALTKNLLDAVFTDGQLDKPAAGGSPREVLGRWKTSGYLSGPDATLKFGLPSEGEYWIRSGIVGFEDDAAEHFYLPERYTDPFDNTTVLKFDRYDLFLESSQDPLGNAVTIEKFDFRVLAPREMEDINGNLSQVLFDVLGMPAAMALKGKGTEGDNLDDFTDAMINPDPQTVLEFFTGNYHANAASNLLGNATARFLYHFGEQSAGGTPPFANHPACAASIVREKHVAHLAENEISAVQSAFEYSDGHGAALVKKAQAEPEPEGTLLRWIASGKTILNNKGKPVKQYEPYFSSNEHRFEETIEVGVTSVMYYDAAGRLVRTEMPDDTFSRVEFSPWYVRSFDPNDTVLESSWYTERNPLDPAHPLPIDLITGLPDYTPDQRAAWLAAQHANTPSLTILDSLGREVIGIAHNKYTDSKGALRNEKYLTFTQLDAEGKPLWIRDARGNLVMQYISPTKPTRAVEEPDQTQIEAMPASAVPCYDIAGNLLFQHSMDAGDRWMLMDAAGKPMLAWDFNQTPGVAPTSEARIYLTEYDQLHRPTKQWLTINADPPKMVERFEYVDTAGNQNINAHKEANLVGQLVKHYDPSGLVETMRLDFSGNVLEVQRRLNNQPRESLIDWQTNPESFLEIETFAQITEYDALKRMTRLYNWHRGVGSRVAVYEPSYNERGVLAREDLVVRATKTASGRDPASGALTQAIRGIRYNAKGQKEYLELGNRTITRYDYDEKTFRLRQLRTTRPAYDPLFPQFRSNLTSAQVLQQLLYTYDPVGNITEIEDQAYKPVYFENGIAEPKSQYGYDALYRLISASGRETAQGGDALKESRDADIANGFPITDQTLRRYTQSYEYDSVGNFVTMHHDVPTDSASSWTRDYRYAFDDPAQPASNRLWQTWTGGDRAKAVTYGYDTHGNMLNLANVSQSQHLLWDHRDMILSINLGGGGTAYYQYDISKQRTRKRIENQNGRGGYWERIYLGGYELYRRYNAANPAVPVEEIESLHLLEGEQRVLLVDDVITASGAVNPRPDGLTVGVQTLFRYQYGNHLGSACLELNHQADVISYEEYHPYGTSAYRAMKSGTEAPPKRYRYTGMERDEESGLSYHRQRYHAVWLAKWVSCDPTGIGDGSNLYQYARGNPIRFSDPKGTQAVDETLERLNKIRGHGARLLPREASAGGGNRLLNDTQAAMGKAEIQELKKFGQVVHWTAMASMAVAGAIVAAEMGAWTLLTRGASKVSSVYDKGTTWLGAHFPRLTKAVMAFLAAEAGLNPEPSVSVTRNAALVKKLAANGRVIFGEAAISKVGVSAGAAANIIEFTAKKEAIVDMMHWIKGTKGLPNLVEFEKELLKHQDSINDIIDRVGMSGLKDRIAWYTTSAGKAALNQASRDAKDSLGPAGKGLAHSHYPDVVLGGDPYAIGGIVDSRINSIIGANAKNVRDFIYSLPDDTKKIYLRFILTQEQ